jgi:hypothetical protein
LLELHSTVYKYRIKKKRKKIREHNTKVVFTLAGKGKKQCLQILRIFIKKNLQKIRERNAKVVFIPAGKAKKDIPQRAVTEAISLP